MLSLHADDDMTLDAAMACFSRSLMLIDARLATIPPAKAGFAAANYRLHCCLYNLLCLFHAAPPRAPRQYHFAVIEIPEFLTPSNSALPDTLFSLPPSPSLIIGDVA